MTAASQCKSRPCFSSSAAVRTFIPATDHRLGSLLHYQLTNLGKAPLKPPRQYLKSLVLLFYRVFYSQVKGRFFTITRPDAILKFILILVHSTCMSHIPLLALALCHYQTELYIYILIHLGLIR